jgi:hypothetical protein
MTTSPEPLPASSRQRRRTPGNWIPAGGPAVTAAAAAPAVTLALLLSACGGSSHPAAASTTAVSQACEQVGAVLTQGPDPDADPTGYAEAQILPLRGIHAPDQRLKTAIDQLATAYQQVFARNGKSATATSAVASASKKVNAICPGAAS